jgi:hypothetical protein
LNVSEQSTEQTSGEPGSLSAGSTVPPSLDAAAAAPDSVKETSEAGSPDLASGQGAAAGIDASRVDAPKSETVKSETAKPEAAKLEAAKPEAPKVEAPKADVPRSPGKVMIMSAGERNWDGRAAHPDAEAKSSQGMFGKRRFAALAAVVVLSVMAGAVGGALATAGFSHFVGGDVASTGGHALEASVARIDADVAALKASIEQTSKLGTTQFNKTSDRLDKVEKAQAEPAARLARLSEAVDKLRAAQPAASALVAASPAAAKEVTGSIAPPATAAVAAPVPLPAPKPEIARLPTVEGWVLRDVANGGALIEGRHGMYEVYAGDPVPGLGRVDAIRRQDGRWVVVTSKGLVTAR